MEISSEILSEITVHMKYARFDKLKKRRETWLELCYRNRNMHLDKYPQLYQEILNVYENFVIPKKVLPSMRSLQFGGKAIEVSPNRMFNCAFLPLDHYKAFSEMMFLLLNGSGVGYSVQRFDVNQLPEIKRPTKTRRYLIGDSIVGWSDAVKALFEAYFKSKSEPIFDFTDIRLKDSELVTSGGKAPGPEPLKTCLFRIKTILDRKQNGEKLTSLECHDIACFIADAVYAGGIRRAALISLFDIDDQEMLTCKFGEWYIANPQRGRANNSAVIVRHKITESEFKKLWEKIEASGSGEPAVYFTNNPRWGTNPCVEIALRNNQFCNLTEVNGSDIKDQQDLEERCKAAAFLGTLQAGYTDFHYLRDIWKKNTEKDSLIGVGMTGIGSGAVLGLDLTKATDVIKQENIRVADIIGINHAARTTCIKPSGTTSCVVGSASGIHGWHSEFFLRSLRVGKAEAIYSYLLENCPSLLEDDFFNPDTQAIIRIPIKAPKGSIFRTEPALALLERVKKFTIEWIKPGHIKGDNTHNISATISIKPEEWQEVGEWMWKNREFYNGLSVLPYDGGTYKQAPFEECTEEKYNELIGTLKSIDLSKVTEYTDTTNLKEQVACGGGKCEV
jgi:ribonucleoside-diphosphate reductase alpha chain